MFHIFLGFKEVVMNMIDNEIFSGIILIVAAVKAKNYIKAQ